MQAQSVQLTVSEASLSSPMLPPTLSNFLAQKLAQIVQTLNEPEIFLKEMAEAIGRAFEVDCCLILLRSNQVVEGGDDNNQNCTPLNGDRCLKPVYGYGTRNLETSSLETVFSEKIGDFVNHLEQMGILTIEDKNTQVSNAQTDCLWQVLKPQAFLAVKTEMQAQVNGGIVLMNLNPHCWTEPQKELLQSLSSQVGAVISHVLDKKAIGTLQAQVGAFTEHRNLIERLTMAVHNSLDLNQILQLAIDGMTQTLQVHQGFVLLLKYIDPLFATRGAIHGKRAPKAKATVVSVSLSELEGLQAEGFLNQSFWVSDCALCSMALAAGPKPLVISDNQEMLVNSLPAVAEIFNFEKMSALLLVPLVGASNNILGGGTILGFLALQQGCPRSWQAKELELVELIAAQLSTAMIQTQTMQHVQALVEERTAQLQRSLEVQAKLYEKTRQQIDQLRRLNQLKDEFLATMSHELRTPLTSMRMAIQMLRQPGLADERKAKYLDILEQQCLQETSLINDLLTLQKLESNQEKLQLQKVDVGQLITQLKEQFERSWAGKKLILSVNLPKRGLKLETDQDSFYRVMEELVTNAAKYSDAGSTISLQFKQCAGENQSQVVMSLSNIGRGIPSEELPYIFDKFRRGQGVTEQAIAGIGLGLALVKSLVQHLNGSINVCSEPCAEGKSWETCFTVTLPQVIEVNKV